MTRLGWTIAVLAGFTVTAAQSRAPGNPPASLFKDSHKVVALARARGDREVSVLVAARPGATDIVAREATRLGGSIRYRFNEIGYLRVRVPIDRVDEFVRHAGIESMATEIDDLGPGARSSPEGLWQASDVDRQWPRRIDDYPLQNPYSPHKDLDADVWLAQHPTWDGRGVTTAVLDGHFDWLLPEFQQALTSDGRPVPKIADVINATDPRDDGHENPQWVDMRAEATSNSGRVTFEGKTFVVPHDGPYRVGIFSERRFTDPANAAYISQDVDRDGNPKEDDGLFGVLWDEASNEVWVDANRNLSFADDRALMDYRVRFDLGTFGADRLDTPVRDSIGFTIQTDRQNKYVSINLGLYQHSSMVVGALAASRRPHGRYDGVAPGSQVISIFYGVNNGHAMIEALILAFSDPRVDIVLLEQNSTVGDAYQLADGRNPMSLLINRMIDRYGKLMLAPGSNAPGLQLVDEPGLASKAISVGGYQSKESYRRNFGFTPSRDDNMHYGGLSHGPSGHGALKPDVLSPSGHIGGDPGYRMGSALKGLYQLPPGYTMGGGTSEATPVAAGAIALLISAAKQTGTPYDPQRLKAALTSGARWIGHLAGFEQGNGLIQVAAAWSLLQALSKGPAPISIESRAPVKTVLSHLLSTADEGVGLFERETWAPGARGQRRLTLTRTSGATEPMNFALAWQGNDGTFTSPATVTLPLNQTVSVTVSITASTPGVHSAVLSLTHPSQPGWVHRVLNTIVVAESFRADAGYRIRFDGDVPRPGDRGFFVHVPAGAPALKVDATPKGAALRLSLLPPDRTTYQTVASTTPGDLSLTVERPMAGVWEINLWNGQDARTFDADARQPLPPTPVSVTAMLAGFAVAAALDGSNGDRSSASFELTGTNRFATISAALAPSALGSAAGGRRSVAAGEQQTFEIDVPAGSETIWARITGANAPGADLDLYLFDCTGKACQAASSSTTTGNDEWVVMANPTAGRWVVVVDAFRTGGTRVDFDYLDVVANPRYGSVTVTDIAEERGAATTWRTMANVWIANPPSAPRRPHALVPVLSPSAKAYRGFGVPQAAALLGFVELPLSSSGIKTVAPR